MDSILFFTCEHSSNQIPKSYKALFIGKENLLNTHHGWDIGARIIHKALTDYFCGLSYRASWSRLLVELNRSPHHFQQFSKATKVLDDENRQKLLEEYYWPYREYVLQNMLSIVMQGFNIVHISVHTFTPIFNGEIRNTDIGLLYDPRRKNERQFCKRWHNAIKNHAKVRLNYPYRGKNDGLTTFFRNYFSEREYCGIEIEVNQKFFTDENLRSKPIIDLLTKTLESTYIRNNQ